MAITKYDETAKYIDEHAKVIRDADGVMKEQVTQEAYNGYMKDHGIAKETIDQLRTVQTDYNNGTIVHMRNKLLENPEIDVITVNTRTGMGVVSARMTRELTTRTPGSGEQNLKHGVVSLRLNMRSRMDKELLADCDAQIAAAVAKA